MATEPANEFGESKAAPRRHSFLVNLLLRLLKEKPLGTFGLVVILLLLLTGIFADFLAPYPMGQIDLKNTLSGPSSEHLLGTDNLGRDMLSQIIYGARVSVIIGLSATAIAVSAQVVIGSMSALIGGKFDLIMQRFVDAWLAIPGMLFLLIMMSIVGRGMVQMIIALSIPVAIGGSRTIRSAVLGIKENAYVEAGRAIGCSTWSLFFRHILPNIMPVVIISYSMIIGGMILMEASLSFLGFGVPPGTPSWGYMLSQEGRQYMEIAPTLALWPGLALTLVVFSANMLGDAMRDLLDPRLKGKMGRYGGVAKKRKPGLRVNK